ncbi:MAG: hypothetical protein KIS66_12620 [Fimbriimonadaceae bacterium]|nr:hypothetical protein [Fimbriimonadaceae bacterium]
MTLILGLAAGCALGFPLSAYAQRGALTVDVGGLRSPRAIGERTDFAVRNFSTTMAMQTRAAREERRRAGVLAEGARYFLPLTVRLENAPTARVRSGSGPLVLQFDAAGDRAFPSAYRDFLTAVFNQVRPTLDVVFGPPSVGGAVRVANYNADIADREYLAGGYYLPDNGAGVPEIRFPVYTSGGEEVRPTAAVNFVHCLLLAYLGPRAFEFDAFQEGLVRAATMRVVRTPGALPATLDADLLEAVLDLNYDAGPRYDWTNQRALGGPVFIAPNLRANPLPIGGSLGGLYLQRFRMAGSAWQKVLTEYPAFASQFLAAYYAKPELKANVPGLVALADTVIRSLGGADARVEGLAFPDWYARQFALETAESRGTKLFVEPIPITDGLGGSDFGVFILESTFFSTGSNGAEELLGGTSYPIFWDPFFNRVFTSGGQDDRMQFSLSYGSVTPNFPNLSGGKPYALTVDVPVQDRIVRVTLPAGGIATAATSGSPNDFYGTVTGLAASVGAVKVRLTVDGVSGGEFPVTEGAFGGKVALAAYAGYRRLLIEVVRTSDSSVVLSRRVNKGPGPLALELRANAAQTFAFGGGLAKGLSMVGMPLDPFATSHASVLGIAEGRVLVARFNPARVAYDLNPDTEAFTQGHGYFVRLEAAKPSFAVAGTSVPNASVAVALRPGWNLVSSPLPQAVPFSRVRVVRGTDFPRTWAESLTTTVENGPWLGADVFRFVPGNPDPYTGAPEGGAMTATAIFEPGVGVFVRVLAPEGLTLLFEPASGASPSPLVVPGTDASWALRIVTRNGASVTDAIVGQHRQATDGFDKALDSALPPGVGGTQASLKGSLYRDVRPLGRASGYSLAIDDLEIGKTYTMAFTLLRGDLREFALTDRYGRGRITLRPGMTYRFTAQRRTQTFEIVAKGVGR